MKFRKAMRWEKPVEQFVERYITGFSLASPCGQSPLGSVKVDLDRANNPDIICSYFALPFRDHIFDSLSCDPIWRMSFFERSRMFFEQMRVVKPEGVIVFNAPWIPTTRRADIIDCMIRQSFDWSNTSILTVFQLLSLE